MKNVAVMGASGRMGQEVIRLLEDSKQLKFQSGVAQNSSDFAPHPKELDSGKVDLVIDFSLPEGFEQVCNWCTENQVALVSGTTGLNEPQQSMIKKLGEVSPVLWAPNMSVGIAVVSELLKQFSSIKDFDFGIEELHHKNKKDSPSGTALHLKGVLEKALGRDVDQVTALRGGGIYGIHKTWAMSPDETITIEHTALNRSVFASGAVRAGEWLVEKPAGVYTLADTLGF